MTINKYQNNHDIVIDIDIEQQHLDQLKNEPLLFVNHKNYKSYSPHCIPLSNPFVYHDALVLANIDAVYNLLDMTNVEFIKSDQHNITYMVIGDKQQNASGLIEYIQYRKPNSYGAGYGEWDYHIINLKSFQPYDGYDVNKTLIYNWKQLIIDMNGDLLEKYNLVFGHVDQNDLNLLFIQCIMGLSCSNQHFVLRCFDLTFLTTNIVGQIIYLLSTCFESISIIKPLASETSCYIVCQYINDNNVNVIDLFKQAMTLVNKNNYITSLFSNELPKDFVIWLSQQNNDILKFKFNDMYDLTLLPLALHLPDSLDYDIKNILYN
jgi:hypothetical protein